jgi:hypothetical protein
MKLTIAPLLLLAAMSSFAFGQAPSSKPNLSGTWVFDASKSALKVTAPTSLTMLINQNDPQIQLSRTQVYGDQSFDWKLDTVTDAQKEVVQKSPLYVTTSRAYWKDNSLVIDQKITANDGTTVNDMVLYSLGDDGKTLQAVEHQTTVGAKGAVTNKWVYEKKAQ